MNPLTIQALIQLLLAAINNAPALEALFQKSRSEGRDVSLGEIQAFIDKYTTDRNKFAADIVAA